MARRSRKSSAKRGAVNWQGPVAGAAVALILGGGLYVALNGSGPSPSRSAGEEGGFDIAAYRTDASRLTGNRYRIIGRVENIDTIGNDRMVAVSVAGNKQERLPLLVPESVSSRVNLTRGDTFVFEADCRTGRDESQCEVKGVLVVSRIETK
ncbi:MAG: hypothetical protein MJ051_02730 [Akkermansia sp.]|nr:hypothetical protein [Akkermansia sp.]